MEHHGLLSDTSFWVLLSTLIFAVVVYVKGRQPIAAMLDARTARIKAELDEAERLREDAQNLLAETQRHHREALHTAQKIVDNARETADRIQQETHQKLEDLQKRREEQLLDRINRAEAAAIGQLKRQAADLAARASEQLLKDAMAKNGKTLVNDAIDQVARRA